MPDDRQILGLATSFAAVDVFSQRPSAPPPRERLLLQLLQHGLSPSLSASSTQTLWTRMLKEIAKWQGNSPDTFTCDSEGRLADPLPEFFQFFQLSRNAKYSDCLGLDPKLALSCASARKSIKQGCRAFLVLVTEDDIARATLAAANVTNSSSTAATSPAVSTACPATAGPEQAGLLQHVDALMLMCLQSPRGCLLTGGWRMSFLYCLTLSLLSSVCTGCLPLRCKRCSGRLLTCCPNS